MKLNKEHKELLLTWIAEGLQSDEMNERASLFISPFSVSREQVAYYRRTRHDKIRELKEVYENTALNTGLALKGIRVRKLKKLAAKMEKDLLEKGLLWTENSKTVAKDAYYYEEFNKAEIDAYRGVLDDIAKELGHRINKTELMGEDGKPVQIALVGLVALGGIDPDKDI